MFQNWICFQVYTFQIWETSEWLQMQLPGRRLTAHGRALLRLRFWPARVLRLIRLGSMYVSHSIMIWTILFFFELHLSSPMVPILDDPSPIFQPANQSPTFCFPSIIYARQNKYRRLTLPPSQQAVKSIMPNHAPQKPAALSSSSTQSPRLTQGPRQQAAMSSHRPTTPAAPCTNTAATP